MSANTRKNARVRTVRQPVEQIWLAGLGALSLTEQEGTKFFRALVRRGEGFEKTTRERLEDVVAATRSAPGNAIARLEEGFSETLEGALRRLGVPSRSEIASLTRRVEGLATTLERQPARRRRMATKTVTRRPAQRPKRRTRTSAPAQTSAASTA